MEATFIAFHKQNENPKQEIENPKQVANENLDDEK